ncbi:hypothetical protein GQ43DRAFT_147832 [Delitschia confertaspora ATCC 74209]|uniref:Uncharacterized protein n=1 Tax=Delitschia confertaspora ATCC 74209 TaxID=1513339 RepID=A0A9P4JFZ6_9PLEO|nr:hypothetical protein GQ43DRAFT_147832 [Delitschia confertaspora ATCC 74209]
MRPLFSFLFSLVSFLLLFFSLRTAIHHLLETTPLSTQSNLLVQSHTLIHLYNFSSPYLLPPFSQPKFLELRHILSSSAPPSDFYTRPFNKAPHPHPLPVLHQP